MDDVTFIIKTLERFYCIKRLVKSIYKYYPDANILIADDSEVSCKTYFYKKYGDGNITVYELEKDCGLSYGRNFLLERVKSKYFVLLDDDFVFDKRTNIEVALKRLEENNLDIIGGHLNNYASVGGLKGTVKYSIQRILHYEKPCNYIGTLNFDSEAKILYVDYKQKFFPDYIDTDVVLNFFLAKTDVIREKNMWENDLKLQEHTPFFFNAKKNGLRIGYTNRWSVQHRPVRSKKYSMYRNRNFVKIFMEKYDIKTIVATYDNGEETVTEYEKL